METDIQELPPETEDMNSAQPHVEDAENTRADYKRWWSRAQELLAYLEKLPKTLTDKVNATERKQKLVFAFDQLTSPESVPEPVPTGAVTRIKTWIDSAEGFVGFLLQSHESRGSTTQAPVLLSDLPEEEWHWPWIEGWDDPKKRNKILNPPKAGDSQVKRLLIGGAVLGGAFYLGKRFMEE